MKKSRLLAKVLMLTAPVIFSASVVMAQTDARAKKPGDKTGIAIEKKQQDLQNKRSVNGVTSVSPAKLNAPSAARPCVTSVRKNTNEITQVMLNKMPKDRQDFVKAHPERFTIVN